MEVMTLFSGDTMEILKSVKVWGLFPAIIILFITVFFLRFTRQSFDVLGERFPSQRLFVKQLSVISRFILVGIGFVFMVNMILDLSGEGLSFFIALIIFGVSFSSRDLIASLMAGLILLFDRPFQVGDRIAFKGFYGEVIEIGLRSVRMVDLDDNQITIPNNQFLNEAVSSANAGNLDQMSCFRFYIGCSENFLEAEQLIHESIAASSYVFWGKPIMVYMEEELISNVNFAIKFTAKAYVIDGRYEELFREDVHKRVKKAFISHNIRTAGQLREALP